jgi:hypothetical protein
MRIISLSLIAFAFLLSFTLTAQDSSDQDAWPKKIEGERGTLVVYQPQIESFVDDKLEARAAISMKTPDQPGPVFGAMWFECRVSTDRDERTVILEEVDVTAAKFPDAKEENVDKLINYLEEEIPKWDLVISLDRLLADLDMDETGMIAGDQLNNEPPEIIFKTTPTVLVMVDGDPIWEDMEKSGYKYVLNTPFFIVKEEDKEAYYLKGGDYWYSSFDPQTGWNYLDQPPKKLEKLAMEYMGEDEPVESTEQDTIIPSVVVRTAPAELLQSGGEPEYEPIPGTSLLFMKNTDDDILMDIETQDYYVLISGRWYKSRSLTENNWTYIPPNEVPEDFANIPSDSEMAVIKSSVSGTQEAKEAVLESQIPQTAEVSRTDAALEVSYDGKPKFEPVGETNMKYAVNTDKSVLLIDGKYYCCDNAVWFESEGPQGPWTVSVSVPDDVQDIPPESPVYNVKYVYIYDYSPSVVYVGYTPGYVHSYVYMGTVYYGTGYYYRPWYGAYYYPRPVTYGFGVHYNPYSGWGFSMTVSRGWFTVGYRSHPGYWGPAGYRHGYHHGYHHGYRHGYNRGAAAGYRAGYQAGQRSTASNNVYRNRSNGVARTGGQAYNPRTGDAIAGSGRPSTRQQPQRADGSNNVYTDRNGNVYKKDGNNWQSRENGQWKDSGPATRDVGTRPSQPQTRDASRGEVTQPTQPATRDVSRDQGARPSQPQTRDVSRPSQAQPSNRDVNRSSSNRNVDNLNRDANARSRGAQRSNNYNQNRQNHQYQRPSGSRPSGGTRPSGGNRGGGARRR